MPATGSFAVAESNVVDQLPNLPVPMQYGTVTWSVSFEGQPSGSLEYQGVLEQDLPTLRSNYTLDKLLTIYGITFRISSFSYQREGYQYKGTTKFSVYQVSVSLTGQYEGAISKEIKLKPLANNQGEVGIGVIATAAGVPYSGPSFKIKIPLDADNNTTTSLQSAVQAHARLQGRYISYTNGISLKPLGGSAAWNFPDTDIITDGPNSVGKTNAYNDAVLTGGFLQPSTPNNTGTPPGVPQFQYLQPNVQTVIEEDEDPASPPPFSQVLRDLSSCFDFSGPKKVRRRTTQIYDQPDTEEVWIYGFAYTAEDIATTNAQGQKDVPLLSTQPKLYWRVIEYQQTSYIYTAPPQLTLQIFATDPLDPTKKYPVLIKPGYQQFATVSSLGGNVTFSSTASYLTSIVSQGWKLVRYQQEQEEQYQTFDATSPSYSTYKFFQLPTISKTTYLLKSSRAQYGEDVGAPFSVEWVNYNDLTPSQQQNVSASTQTNSQGQVAILTPDINYVEPLFVEAETTGKSGFSHIVHPEKPFEILSTGEESYQQVTRKIIGSNRYKEKSTEYSSQDPGFSTSLEQIRFKEVLGKPPEASYRMATAQQSTSPPTQTNASQTAQRYLVSTDGAGNASPGGSLDYSDAETLQQAIIAIRTELEIEEVQASTQQKTVTWFYPNIRDGDRVSTGMDKFASLGSWIVKSASWTLNYHGNKANMGPGVLVTTDGTQLTLGLVRSRSVSYQVQNIPVPPTPNAGEGQITTNFTGGAFTLGSVFSNQPHRRNF